MSTSPKLSNDPSDFRVHAREEVLELLQQLVDGPVPLTLSTPQGDNYTTIALSADADRRVLCLDAQAHDTRLQRLMQSDEIVAVGYLDRIKLQFDLQDLVLVHGANGSALNVQLPREIYRFQRRSAFRVRPLLAHSPVAIFAHPDDDGRLLKLRVLDVSVSGMALLMPEHLPPIEPGVQIDDVVIELDADTRLCTRLVVHHITHLDHESNEARLGCELPALSAENARQLTLYIEQTQKKRRLLSL